MSNRLIQNFLAQTKDPEGFKKQQKLKEEYRKKGTKSGIERVQSGTRSYKVGPNGRGSEPVYRYIRTTPEANKRPAARAPAAPKPAASNTLMPQISEASKQYRADTQALSDKIAKQQADFDASQAAAAKLGAIAAANQARQGQTSNLQIQPASSTSKTSGTGAFRSRKKRKANKKQLASNLNIGQSNTLNI